MHTVNNLPLSRTLDVADRADILTVCREAAEWEDLGEYGEAARCLAPVWGGVGYWPFVEGLEADTAAEVLLRVGSLTAWLGDAQALKGVQDKARDILDRATTYFRAVGNRTKTVEARNAVAITYWREAAYENARDVLAEAFKEQDGGDSYLRLAMMAAFVDIWDGKADKSIKMYKSLEKLVGASTNKALQARYHHNYALALRKCGELDRSLEQYDKSLHFLDLLGNIRLRGNVENNIAHVHLHKKEYELAHAHLRKARDLFERCGDRSSAGQVDDSIAQVFLAENRPEDAEPIARRSVEALETGEGVAFLVEALETHGKALARLNQKSEAAQVLWRAEELAATAIGTERAAKIALMMIDELSTPAYLESGLTFDEAVHRFEEQLLRAALHHCNGSMREAALKLGLEYDTLRWMLKHRHKELMAERSPFKERRKSILKKSEPKGKLLSMKKGRKKSV